MLYVEITHQNGTVESFGARLYAPHYEDRGTWDPFYGRFHESLSTVGAWLKRNDEYKTRNLMHNEASFAGL